MENIENVAMLQNLAKDFRILFVEDSKALQKQVSKFLEKLFMEVYVASDGEEGLEFYERYQPDLILTDLTMPKMTGHEMIRAIKKIDPDVEVIILSAHSDTETLMKSLHIGVSDFIPKPANASKMIGVFLKVLSNMKRKEVTVAKEEIEILVEDTPSNEDEEVLEFIFENGMQVDIINHYRGVPIINGGKIISIEEDQIIIKTTYIQLLAIKHEGGAILDSSLIGEDIQCNLISVNIDEYMVILEKDKLFYPEFKDRNELKLEVEKEFEAKVLDENKKLGTKVLYISKKELAFELSTEKRFKKHESLKLQLSFPPLKNISSMFSENIFTLDTTIYKVEQDGDMKKVTVLLKNNHTTDEVIQKYIYNREIDLIDEFKDLYHY